MKDENTSHRHNKEKKLQELSLLKTLCIGV